MTSFVQLLSFRRCAVEARPVRVYTSTLRLISRIQVKHSPSPVCHSPRKEDAPTPEAIVERQASLVQSVTATAALVQEEQA
jgi:hypothetical protein